MAKRVISFKLEGNGSIPFFVKELLIHNPVTGVDFGKVQYGSKFLAISVDEANYWIPPTVDRFETAELCLAELTGAVLLVQGTEAVGDGELVETWTERALTAEEKTQIVANLFASVI